jgi:hypothetical protein
LRQITCLREPEPLSAILCVDGGSLLEVQLLSSRFSYTIISK